MPEVSRFYDIIITMYVSDHNPPHFHVRYKEYRSVVVIEERHIIGKIPVRVMRLVLKWLDLHKEELLDNWNRLAEGKSIVSIKPLE